MVEVGDSQVCYSHLGVGMGSMGPTRGNPQRWGSHLGGLGEREMVTVSGWESWCWDRNRKECLAQSGSYEENLRNLGGSSLEEGMEAGIRKLYC